MAAWTATVSLARVSASKARAASLIHQRGLAGGGDHHGAPKVNFWEHPLTPSKWKQEQFVIVSLSGCGLLIYGGYKFFTQGKKDEKDENIGESSH